MMNNEPDPHEDDDEPETQIWSAPGVDPPDFRGRGVGHRARAVVLGVGRSMRALAARSAASFKSSGRRDGVVRALGAEQYPRPVAVALLLFGMATGLLAGWLWRPSSQSQALVPEATPEPSAASQPDSDEQRSEPGLTERASAGDLDALRELTQTPEDKRSIDQTVALWRGQTKTRMHALESLIQELHEGSASLQEEEARERVREFFADDTTMVRTGEALVGLKDTLAYDLLYDLWVGTKDTTRQTQFAKELVNSPQARGDMSPALRVALELRTLEACEDIRGLLAKVLEVGDSRTVRVLVKLNRKTGCGDEGSEDCYPCLRVQEGDRDALDVLDVVRVVRRRASPRVR